MIPVTPKPIVGGVPLTLAKDQPQYRPLPAIWMDPYILTTWHLTLWERLRILLTGKVYLSTMTFGSPLQPIRLSTKSFIKE